MTVVMHRNGIYIVMVRWYLQVFRKSWCSWWC